MRPSEKCYKFIAERESCRLKAYPDGGGVPTIGYGNTFYEDGTPVKLGDQITIPRAKALFKHIVDQFAEKVEYYLDATVNQNQFDALVSLAYNIGLGAFSASTLLKKVDANPDDPAIRKEFMKWVFDNGKRVQGLYNRRRMEANMYFTAPASVPQSSQGSS